MIDFKTGPSFRLFYPGMILFIAGIAVCFYNWIAGLPLMAIAVYVVISPSGVEIDATQARFRKYIQFYLFKAGFWKSYLPESGVSLDLYTSKSSARAIAGAQTNWYGSGPGKSFLVHLTGVDGKRIEIKEIMNYPEARAFANDLAGKLGILFIDNAETFFNKAAQTRRKKEAGGRK